jgi:hypothetical protein
MRRPEDELLADPSRGRIPRTEDQMNLSKSKECRIKWWIARLRDALVESHASLCKCKACHFADKLRDEFEKSD